MTKSTLTVKALGLLAISAFTTMTVAQDLNSMATGPKAEKAPPPSCEPAKKDPEAWDLSAAMGFNFTKGNADTRLLTASFDATKEKDSNVYIFNLSGADGEQNKVDTQRFIRGKAAYERLLSERFYVSTTGTFITDDIADVDYRVVLSPAAGYYLLKSEETKLSAETGPAYVFEKQGGLDDNYLAWRVADNFSWKFSPTAKLFQYADYLLNTDNTNQSIILAKGGIEASLTSMLALVLSVEDRYNNLPAAGRKKNDVLVTSALKVSF